MPKTTNTEGIIIRIQGPVVDVRFDGGTPLVNEALVVELSNKNELILETALLIGDNEVKTLAMGSTDGLSRGVKVKRTFSSIKVPRFCVRYHTKWLSRSCVRSISVNLFATVFLSSVSLPTIGMFISCRENCHLSFLLCLLLMVN